MSTSDQGILFSFAKEVFSQDEFDRFVRLIHLREHKNARVRAEANAELLPLIGKLKAYQDIRKGQQLHAV